VAVEIDESFDEEAFEGGGCGGSEGVRREAEITETSGACGVCLEVPEIAEDARGVDGIDLSEQAEAFLFCVEGWGRFGGGSVLDF
jgi:hypothetical protein